MKAHFRRQLLLALMIILVFISPVYATDHSTVLSVQQYLNSHGYDCGTPDGISGSKTASAIISFQTDHGMVPDGQITDELLEYIASSDYNTDPFLDFTVLDVGQGLSILIQTENGTLLYDGGPGTASSKVVAYLQSLGISIIDYIIASHYDEDHISGVIGAIRAFDVGTVIGPKYTSDTKIYDSLMKALDSKGIPLTYAEAGESFQLGSAVVQILMPLMATYLDENDYSVVVKITEGENSILITGDCSSIGEGDMLLAQEDVDSDILVLGHHGSNSSSSQAFLDAVTPEYAVVSCGAGNSYGHPAQEVMDRLAVRGIGVYRTDTQGNLYFHTDGDGVWICDEEPSGDYSGYGGISVDRTLPEPVYEQPVGASYVLNTNTMKFHYPSCSSVGDIYAQNRWDVNMTRDEIISMGYVPCKWCKP